MLTKQRRSGVSQIEEHLSTRPGSYSQIFENMQMQKNVILAGKPLPMALKVYKNVII